MPPRPSHASTGRCASLGRPGERLGRVGQRRAGGDLVRIPGSPLSTAIAILVLVTAAALAAVAVGVAGWLAGFPAVAAGLGACGAFASIFGMGLYITYWRPGQKPDASPRDSAAQGPASG